MSLRLYGLSSSESTVDSPRSRMTRVSESETETSLGPTVYSSSVTYMRKVRTFAGSSFPCGCTVMLTGVSPVAFRPVIRP